MPRRCGCPSPAVFTIPLFPLGPSLFPIRAAHRLRSASFFQSHPTILLTNYGTVRAPEFPEGLQWLNTPHPLRLNDLRGKFVLLDFWTFCCINCMHVLPDLKRLEHKYPYELVVIGVHSAKFANEQQTESIRNAIVRYDIEHPVVNDPAFVVWQHYAVRAWPTLFLIDPKGYIVRKKAGEGVFEPFDAVLTELIPTFEKDGVLDRTPLATHLERDHMPEQMLSFPGKIAGDEASGRLFISDSNHHRLLITDLEGQVLAKIGHGKAGFDDGAFEDATFRQPQGVCYDADTETLYVADTENHALRHIDLRERRVETLAGNGMQAQFGTWRAKGAASPLNSPWDVLLHRDAKARAHLYVAMAGPHQLWVFDPKTGKGETYAGNGHEHIVDDKRLKAQLAQPSGLASDGTILYFVDSETSALRRVPFGKEKVAVETLIGEGLFDFGDVDGRYPEARLQHPLGIAFADGVIYVADSYNHKVKRYDPADGALVSLLGTGAQGYHDGGRWEAQFNEPGGLAVVGHTLFVADTNNHQIRRADLTTGQVTTVPIAEPLTPEASAPSDTITVLAAQTVAPGDGTLVLDIMLPDGFEPNDLHTGTISASSLDPDVAHPTTPEPQPIVYPMQFPFVFAVGKTEITLTGTLYYCDKANGRCLLEPLTLRLPLTVQPDAAHEASSRFQVGS